MTGRRREKPRAQLTASWVVAANLCANCGYGRAAHPAREACGVSGCAGWKRRRWWRR